MKTGWVDSTVFKFQTENQPNKQTTSTEHLMASQLNAIQDWNILKSLGFTVCFSRYLMMTLIKQKLSLKNHKSSMVKNWTYEYNFSL